jgi:hypothetical protein
MILCRAGKIGSVSLWDLRLRPLYCVNVSTPRRSRHCDRWSRFCHLALYVSVHECRKIAWRPI